MSLIALSLNPNITPEEFRELAEEHRKNVVEAFEHFGTEAAKLPPEVRIHFIQSMLPILLQYALL